MTEALEPKRIGILREMLPQVPKLAVLVNPKFAPAHAQSREIDEAARTFGIQTQHFRASTESEIEIAFQSMAEQHMPALIVATDPFFVNSRNDLIAIAARHRLPTIYGFRDLAMAGGLMSYGIDLAEVYRQLGRYAARILKGTKAADLPVMQPTKLELVINLKTARTLGLEVPPTLLALADEVIE